jgi:hypothetical protein
LDSFRVALSACLHLLIGFDPLEAGRVGRLPPKAA